MLKSRTHRPPRMPLPLSAHLEHLGGNRPIPDTARNTARIFIETHAKSEILDASARFRTFRWLCGQGVGPNLSARAVGLTATQSFRLTKPGYFKELLPSDGRLEAIWKIRAVSRIKEGGSEYFRFMMLCTLTSAQEAKRELGGAKRGQAARWANGGMPHTALAPVLTDQEIRRDAKAFIDEFLPPFVGKETRASLSYYFMLWLNRDLLECGHQGLASGYLGRKMLQWYLHTAPPASTINSWVRKRRPNKPIRPSFVDQETVRWEYKRFLLFLVKKARSVKEPKAHARMHEVTLTVSEKHSEVLWHLLGHGKKNGGVKTKPRLTVPVELRKSALKALEDSLRHRVEKRREWKRHYEELKASRKK